MKIYIRMLPYLIMTIFILLFYTCGELPSDPSTNPNNVTATISVPDGTSGIV